MTRRPAQLTWATTALTTCWSPTSSAPVRWRPGSLPSTWSTPRWCRPDTRSADRRDLDDPLGLHAAPDPHRVCPLRQRPVSLSRALWPDYPATVCYVAIGARFQAAGRAWPTGSPSDGATGSQARAAACPVRLCRHVRYHVDGDDRGEASGCWSPGRAPAELDPRPRRNLDPGPGRKGGTANSGRARPSVGHLFRQVHLRGPVRWRRGLGGPAQLIATCLVLLRQFPRPGRPAYRLLESERVRAQPGGHADHPRQPQHVRHRHGRQSIPRSRPPPPPPFFRFSRTP